MKKEKIAEILDDKLKKLTKLSADIAPQFEKDAIHNFRVEVKQLRSFLRLLSIHKKEEYTLPKKFKRLYDIVGIIREMQLEQKKLQELNADLPVYFRCIEDTIALQKQLWENHYDHKVLKELKEKMNGLDVKTLHPANLSEFIEQRMNALQKINEGEPNNEQIHTYRKQVKDIIYNIKLAEKDWKKALQATCNLSAQALDKLSDTIGDYNDERILLDHLIAFSTKARIPAEEQKQLLDFCSAEMKKQILKKRKLQQAIKKFLKAHLTS